MFNRKKTECGVCGIETKDIFTSKAKAIKAFEEGKTKKIAGNEVAGNEQSASIL